MLDTLEHLLPAIPQTLYAGLGKPKIERLIGLRSQAERTWNRYPTDAIAFPEFWLDTLGQFDADPERSEEHTSELQSLMRISYAVFCLTKNNYINTESHYNNDTSHTEVNETMIHTR